MKYFNFLNIMCVAWLVCVCVLIHAQITGIVDFRIVAMEFINLAKSL